MKILSRKTPPSKSRAIRFHVSPLGSDRWSGLLPLASKGDGPFATLERARNAVRAFRKKNGKSIPAEVIIAGGVYELSQTLELGPEDGETVWRAAKGERPVLSGGRRLRGFSEKTVDDRSLWRLDLPEVKSGAWRFSQLWIDGSRRPRPRLPKQGFFRFAGLGEQTDTGSEWTKGPDHAEYVPGDLRAFRNLEDTLLVAQQLWFEMPMRIVNIDEKKRVVHFHHRCLGSLCDETGKFARYVVENVAEALTEPGEWYLDRPAGTLSILPKPGDELEQAHVVAPRLERLLRIAGRPGKPVHNIIFEGISFQHCDWHPPADYAGSVQAGFKIPGALLFEHAESCVLYCCEVAHTAQYAVQIGRNTHDCRVVACHLHDLGAGGVRVDHEWLAPHESAVKDLYAGEGETRPRAATVSDCEIHDGGHVSPSSIGIFVGNAGHCRILHNHIHYLRYTGISVGWTWGYAPSATICNHIDGNHIHHVNHDNYLSDNGGIYTLGEHHGSTINGNHVHHVGAYGYGGWGIYLDEGSSFFRVEDNTVHHCKDAGFFTHYGRSNLLRGNIFAWNGAAQVSPGQRVDRIRSASLEDNVVVWEHGRAFPPNTLTPRTSAIGRNLFCRVNGPALFGDGLDLAALQAKGQAQGSFEADPLLVPTTDGGYAPRADSPAARLGVKTSRSGQSGPRWRGTPPATWSAWRRLFADASPAPALAVRLSLPSATTLAIKIENRGPAAAPAGSLRLKGTTGVKIRSPLVAWKRIIPGEFFETERTIAVPATEGWWGIEARSSDATVPIAAIGNSKPAKKKIARLTTPGKLEAAATTLMAIPEFPLTAVGKPYGRARWALAGEHLLMRVEIDDPQPKPSACPWQGACLEVFIAAKESTNAAGIRQLFLMPDDTVTKLVSLVREGRGNMPAPEIAGSVARRENGWELTCRVPLQLLNLSAGCDGFFGELKATLRPRPNADIVSAWAFGATTAFTGTDGMPWFS